MVANLNRQPVARAHLAKRYDLKRHPQVAAPATIPAPVVAVPPKATPPQPAVVPPKATPPQPAAVQPPASAPAAPPLATSAPPVVVNAPFPIVTPATSVSNGSVVKIPASSTTGGSPSPVPSATKLVVKPITTTHTNSFPPSASPSLGNATGAVSGRGHGLSGGGIAGIVIALLIALSAVLFFVKRRRAIMMRKGKRNWGGDLFPKTDGLSEKSAANPPTSQYAFQGHANAPVLPTLTPLSASYNNPTYPSPVSPSATSGGRIISTHNPADLSGKSTAIIRCTFIPALPDELSITTGETVTVIHEYDDGWALCVNGGGDEGMVPLECLQREAATPRPHDSDWKNAQRASSLIFRDGVRY